MSTTEFHNIGIDHEIIALAKAGHYDQAVRGTHFSLYRVGRHLLGIRDDGSVFLEKSYSSPERAGDAFRALIEADQSNQAMKGLLE